MHMKQLVSNRTTLLVAALVLIGATIAAQQVVQHRLGSLELLLSVKVTEQKALLATIAETTARNGADSVTEAIVIDCPIDERSRHDELLGRLDQGLTPSELTELNTLFAGCGSFYAERKSVMVARLDREIAVYKDYVKLLSSVTGKDEATEHRTESWQELVEGEQTQSVLFSELVRLQGEIIEALIAGNSPQSERIESILVEVQETRESLLLAKTKTDTLRAELTTL